MTISEYFLQFKLIIDYLVATGKPMDEEAILNTLNGPLAEYVPFYITIGSHSDDITIEELHNLLIKKSWLFHQSRHLPQQPKQ